MRQSSAAFQGHPTRRKASSCAFALTGAKPINPEPIKPSSPMATTAPTHHLANELQVPVDAAFDAAVARRSA
jgi:hypothetical protein